MGEEVECRKRRICKEVTNPYMDDDYMQTKSEKVGIKERERKRVQIQVQLKFQEYENPSATSAADALLLQSDYFKV